VVTLSVWEFDRAEGADQALSTLNQLQREEAIKVVDAAIVTWPADKKKPRTRQLHDLTMAGAAGGAFWGLLFGLIFLMPLLGMAAGAAAGALMGSMRDVGIDDTFIKQVRETVKPGTSALFVMTAMAVEDKVRAAFQGQRAQLLHTNLNDEQEARLRAAFSDE